MGGYKATARRCTVGVTVTMALLLVGCAGSGQTRLYAEDDGGQMELELGQVVEVVLRSNPTTGYRWERVDSGDGVLVQEGEAELQQEAKDRQLVGAGGVKLLRFKAQSTGQTMLELVYRRTWEKEEKPEETFSVQVTVR